MAVRLNTVALVKLSNGTAQAMAEGFGMIPQHFDWRRGQNENTNGLLRQYPPKGSDLFVFSQPQLDDIAWKLNTRPRKSLDWKCPAELFLPEDAFDFKACWADKLGIVALGFEIAE